MEINFCGIKDISINDAKFLIIPIPYESTSSFKSGTKFAPLWIIHASEQLELFDEEVGKEIYKVGIKTLPPITPDCEGPSKMVDKIKRCIERYLKREKIIIGIGGEHTITVGILYGFLKKYNSLKILHLDAHGDLRNEYQGTKFSHACVIRRILEKGCDIFSVGVRSLSMEEWEFLKSERNIKVYFANLIEDLEKISKNLPSGDYYITIDADFFDPSLFPEVSVPEPGGFGWFQSLKFLKNFIMRKDINIVGFDFVELSPSSPASNCCYIASKLIYKLIGYIGIKNGEI
ncbi:MAG: agmatinase [Candidatus Omnitrophota bacterium]|nr:MAG: agmatinase [Candidatus Omnitrophota bacterium]